MPALRLALVVSLALLTAVPSPAQHTAHLVPGTEGMAPRNLLVAGDTLYFIVCEVVCDTAGDAEGRRGLWGYHAATGHLAPRVEFDVHLSDAPFPIYNELIAYDDALFFNADDGVHGDELWRYDPATGQAALVADLWPGSEDSTPRNFTIYDDALYFRATDETHGPRLRSYRTGEGIHTLDHSPSPFLLSMVALDDRLYLVNGSSLVSYESTTDQFTTLTHPFDENRAAVQGRLTVYDERIYVQAHTQEHGLELWSYDPATDDFSLVADIIPGSESSSPSLLTAHDGALYFLAADEAHGAEFWHYDGSGPPRLVADINPGPGHSVPSVFTPFEERLYFHANDGETGAELWMYDPATDEVALAADLAPGSASSSPYWIVPYDSALYVATRNSEAETDGALWRVEHAPPTSSNEPDSARSFALHPPVPNPARGAVTLSFTLPSPANVHIEAFDVLGRRVARLAEGPHAAGEHRVAWGDRLPSGVYVVRLRAGEHVQTRRVTLLR